MSKYSLCIIDDQIPVNQFNDKIEVDETGIIDKNVLSNYIRFAAENSWEDTDLYNLVKQLKESKTDEFVLSAFTNHSFYINHIDENIYSPDIIIFDWDIGTSDKEPTEYLKQILERTYCLIIVYTRADKDNEVTAILKDFTQFSHRLFLQKKDCNNSVNHLISQIENKIKYFAFSYGAKFKYNINSAINSIFSTIGKLSFEQFINTFGEKYNETLSDGKSSDKCRISYIDFIEIMNEQIKSQLLSLDVISPIKTDVEKPDLNIEKKLWHFRMFHSPKDNLVRKGDIVFHNEKNKYFLIISSDCHLSSFWSKNLGALTLVPLYKCDDKDILDRIEKYTHEDSRRQFRNNSLVNTHGVTGITIIPALDGINDYIVSPKEIESINIKMIENEKALTYTDIPSFNANLRYRLNEPFLSSLIEFILRNITDIGTPDYSKTISESLKNIIKNI